MSSAQLKSRTDEAWQVLSQVPDPEIPVISLVELGIVRDVRNDDEGQGLVVVLTPTYSGCPATEVITADVCAAINAQGLGPVRIEMQRAPAWTTDWISAEGRRKLSEYGIAPPGPRSEQVIRFAAPALNCPRCDSRRTERLSAFGATACKSLYRCLACGEPFEHFKSL